MVLAHPACALARAPGEILGLKLRKCAKVSPILALNLRKLPPQQIWPKIAKANHFSKP